MFGTRKLGRTSDQRKAMLRQLTTDLLENGKLETTFCRAKEVQPDELERAFEYGIAFDASAIPGFGSEIHSDLFLQPDTGTLCVLPWRPDHGRVVRMFCSILHPDGTPFESDTRRILQNAVDAAAERGISF